MAMKMYRGGLDKYTSDETIVAVTFTSGPRACKFTLVKTGAVYKVTAFSVQ
jgi:hypothetical protein